MIRFLGRVTTAIEVVREGSIPDPPFVVAANHYSHLDPPLVGAAIGQPIRFLAVDELWGISRALDLTLDTFGSIPLPRDRTPVGTVRTALRLLERGENVGVFPEATRVRRWGDRPLKRGAAWLAARASVPLVPVAVFGTDRIFGVDNKWHWGRMRAVVGKPLQPGDIGTTLASWQSWMSDHLS